ncbi:metal ABC transporter ATP-binding protein [Candidatus Uhrbacteria bacterium]|nr:metal ABC transporter ATP-binding protein [Candidatus Uhrbacteria bacterium]
MREQSQKINNQHPMIQVKNLSVVFGNQTILSHVSFDVNHGEIAAIIGPNGSGKTTLIRAVLGLIPSDGEVLIDNEPPSHVRSHVGYVPQRFRFDPNFPITVREYLDLPKPHVHKHEHAHKLKEVGLEASILHKPLGSLSGGQLQRVLIAQATIHHPSLLILDEPSTGIDIVGEEQFYDLLKEQRDQHGTTVVLVSHDIAVISNVVDQVICVNKKLVCFGPPKQALTQEKLSELYGKTDTSLYFHHRHY